jgi:capsular polysaccharide biosynthesis protein
MTNLVLGLCTNYNLEKVMPFLLSWRNNVKSSKMALFVAHMANDFTSFAEAHGVELIDPAPMLETGFHPLNARFFMYRLLLRLRRGQYESVMLTDTRDVIFQSDPFLIPRSKPVYFAQEHQTIASEQRWNARWLREIYGETLLDEIKDNYVSCAGTTIGTQEGILSYLDLLCNELMNQKIDRGVNYNQGVHNYIAWKLKPDFIAVDTHDEIFNTIARIPTNRIEFVDNQIKVDGNFPSVIHQWDRLQVLSEYIAHQISDPNKAFIKIPTSLNYAKFVEADRRRFFAEVFDHSTTLLRLLSFYIDYTGTIYSDQSFHFYNKLEEFLPENHFVINRTALAPDKHLRKEFLDEVAPGLSSKYFSPRPVGEVEKIELLPRTTFEWRDEKFPATLDATLHCMQREAFIAYISRGGTAFLGPSQFQYFFEKERLYQEGATSRPYSDSILQYPRLTLNGDVVLIQDNCSGANFAHFVFDWLTRVLHVLHSGIISKQNCYFLMGGELGAFQKLLLEQVCEIYGLSLQQFIFPQDLFLFEINGRFIFFSDIILTRLHPAQLAASQSMALLREVTLSLPVQKREVKRLFISRADAALRKITNEDDLFDFAHHAYGFEKIVLSDVPVEEQIALFRGAECVIGAHGMGMTHLIFHEGPLKILELFHPNIGTGAYAIMAQALGFPYSLIVGEEIDDNKGSYTVPLKAFAQELAKMLESSKKTISLHIVSAQERLRIFERIIRSHPLQNRVRKLFAVANYTPADLAVTENALIHLGFDSVKAEELPEEKAIQLFAGTEIVIALGREALTNVRYCAPGTFVVAITAPGEEEGVEEYLASLDLRYIKFVGESEAGGWRVNPERLVAAVQSYIS